MAVIHAALSIETFIDKVGNYAGFAAAIGLALFALLLFAQARELKRLREWGAHAHDRIGEMETRLAAALELARRAGASQRTGAVPAQRAAPAASQRPGASAAPAPLLASTRAPTRLPLLPAAPVGVAGAALGSATVILPLPRQLPGAVPTPAGMPAPVTAAPASSPAPATSPTAVPAAIPAAATVASAAAPGVSAAPPTATPAPATAAGRGPSQPPAANGHSDTFPPVPPVRRAAPAPRPGARPGARPGRRVVQRRPARPAAAAPLRASSTPSATPRGTGNGQADQPTHGHRRLGLLLAALALVAVAAVAVLFLSGGDDPSTSASSTPAVSQPAGDGQDTSGATLAHDRITVAVLNGTTTAGLANTVATTLTDDGFLRGPVTNASDQGRTVTVISYFDGQERAAQEVADVLGVSSDAVGPIDSDTETACAQGADDGICTATVVVTVGADRQ